MKNGRKNFFRVFVATLCIFYFADWGYTKDLEFKRYQVESGMIQYTISGVQKGKETVYFDHWGMREARYSTIQRPLLGIQHILTISDQQWTYIIDLDKKVGNKLQNNILRNFISSATARNSFDLSEEMMKYVEGEKIRSEAILGKMCDVWQSKKIGTVYWFWKWIPIKTQVVLTSQQETVSIATKIEENIPIPEEKFQIPKKVLFIHQNINTIVISSRIGK